MATDSDTQGNSAQEDGSSHGSTAPAERLGDMLTGFMVTQDLYVAARLGIADTLRQGPRAVHDIAAAVNAHEPSMQRLLSFLTRLDVLTVDEHGLFSTTEMGDLLRSDHPESEHPWAQLLGAPFIWRPWGELYETIVTGESAFDRVYAETFFAYLAHSPKDADVFNAAMSTSSSDNVPAILAAYDQGALLRGILEQYPEATAVVFDLPAVIESAEAPTDPSVAARCKFAAGDMFQSIPPGGDAYILQRVVHDWNDTAALRILENCRKEIGDQGKLLLIERIVDASRQSPDLMMLVLVGGRERTEEEFRNLLAAARFRLNRVIPAGEFSVLEALPVKEGKSLK